MTRSEFTSHDPARNDRFRGDGRIDIFGDAQAGGGGEGDGEKGDGQPRDQHACDGQASDGQASGEGRNDDETIGYLAGADAADDRLSINTANDQNVARGDSADDWSFRRLTTDDFELLKSWLEQPAVARWWAHDTSPAAIEADFGPSARGDEPTEVWIAELGGRPVGLIQRYWWHDYPDDRAEVETGWPNAPTPSDTIPDRPGPDNSSPDRPSPDNPGPDSPIPLDAVSIDYFIGESDHLGRGRGPTMIDAFVTTTFTDWVDATTIIVAVHADNRPSWRALEKAGFTIVGAVDLEPDNPIDDRRHVLARRDRGSY